MRMRWAATLVGSVVLAQAAQAQSTEGTVGWLVESCQQLLRYERLQDDQLSSDAVFCEGYATGVAQVMAAACEGASSMEDPAPVMASSVPHYGLAIEAFLNWAEKNPGTRQEPVEGRFISAVAEAFPCTG